MSLGKQIEKVIIQKLLNCNIEDKLIDLVIVKLDDMITFEPNEDHKSLPKVEDSILDQEKLIEELDEFTHQRRKVYELNPNSNYDKEKAEDLKREALDSNEMTKELVSGGKKIRYSLFNKSEFIKFMLGGVDPTYASQPEKTLKEAYYYRDLATGNSGSKFREFQVWANMLFSILGYSSNNPADIHDIPARDFLHVALQTISKDDLINIYKQVL